MKTLSFVGVTILASALVACSSAPIHYYTLQLPPAADHALDEPPPFDIDVLPVGIPVQLDQQPLVVRESDNRMTIRDSERWTSPYDEEIRSALATNLARRLNTMNVTGLPRSKDRAVLRVKLQIRQFDVWPGKQVVLDTNWSLAIVGDSKIGILTCHGRLSTPTPYSYPQIVSAQQQVLDALSARIAKDARTLASSEPAHCTTPSPLISPPNPEPATTE